MMGTKHRIGNFVCSDERYINLLIFCQSFYRCHFESLPDDAKQECYVEFMTIRSLLKLHPGLFDA